MLTIRLPASVVGAADKTLRVKEYRGVLSIKPSTRSNPVKDEGFGALTRDADSISATVTFDKLGSGKFGLSKGKYGWLTLVDATDETPVLEVAEAPVAASAA